MPFGGRHTYRHKEIPCSVCFKILAMIKDIVKFLEENRDKTFSDINYTNVFLGQSSKAIEIKAKINGI